MILLTLRDLQHRVVRFIVVTVLAAVVFTLLFVMTGLVEQFHREPVDTVDAFGADQWVVQEGISGPFTASPTLDVGVAGQVSATTVAPAVIGRSSVIIDDESSEVFLVGHEDGTLGSPPTSDGHPATASGEAVIDDRIDADIGDTILVAGVPFQVVGTTKDTTMLAGVPLVFVRLEDAQDLLFKQRGLVSVVLTKGPTEAPDGTIVLTAREVSDDAFRPIENAVASVDLVRVLLWLVAAVIIGAVVYLSALERQRDFAVLKAIGASNRSLMGSLALQAVLVALCAVLLASGLQRLLVPAFPLEVRVPSRAFVQLPVFAVLMALVAGAAGLRKVATSDPAAAFAGAGG